MFQGVKHVKLRGRLCILLGPLTNIIPLVTIIPSEHSESQYH